MSWRCSFFVQAAQNIQIFKDNIHMLEDAEKGILPWSSWNAFSLFEDYIQKNDGFLSKGRRGNGLLSAENRRR